MAKITFLVAFCLLAAFAEGFMGNPFFNDFPGFPKRYNKPGRGFPSDLFLDLPQPPSLPFFGNINLPSPSDILNTKPLPGQSYQGVVMHSGPQGTKVIVNKDGKVEEKLFDNTQTDSRNKEQLVDNQIMEHNYNTPIWRHEQTSYRRRQYPDTSNSYGVVMSSHSHMSNNDGKQSGGGGIYTMVNNNGNIKEDFIKFDQ